MDENPCARRGSQRLGKSEVVGVRVCEDNRLDRREVRPTRLHGLAEAVEVARKSGVDAGVGASGGIGVLCG